MTVRLTTSTLAILSWMKEQPSPKYVSLDRSAAQFGLDREQMRRNLQWLQRYECVKRGGEANAEWAITELGLVRLAAGKFSQAGAFVSPFDHTPPKPARPEGETRETVVTTESEPLDGATLDRWTRSGYR